VLALTGDAKPDMASLTMGSMNFPVQAYVNTPEMIERLATAMTERGIVPEIEVFEAGMINTVKVLMRKEILRPPFYMNILLGSLYSAPASLFDLSCMVQSLPQGFCWAATGIGMFQLNINVAAVLMGGHVRVGLEDNIYFDNERKTLATNEELIRRIVRLSSALGRETATPREAREMIGLPRETTRDSQ
jgi:uncharacterized protein (DUF849 family)